MEGTLSRITKTGAGKLSVAGGVTATAATFSAGTIELADGAYLNLGSKELLLNGTAHTFRLLSGATLRCGRPRSNSAADGANATFHADGGIVRPTDDGTWIFANIANVTVGDGGLIIDPSDIPAGGSPYVWQYGKPATAPGVASDGGLRIRGTNRQFFVRFHNSYPPSLVGGIVVEDGGVAVLDDVTGAGSLSLSESSVRVESGGELRMLGTLSRLGTVKDLALGRTDGDVSSLRFSASASAVLIVTNSLSVAGSVLVRFPDTFTSGTCNFLRAPKGSLGVATVAAFSLDPIHDGSVATFSVDDSNAEYDVLVATVTSSAVKIDPATSGSSTLTLTDKTLRPCAWPAKAIWPKKIIATGSTRSEDLETLAADADAYEATGLDGIQISLNGKLSDGRKITVWSNLMNGIFDKKTQSRNPLALDRSMFEHNIPLLREITRRPYFRHCFTMIWLAPARYGRYDWRDDATWARAATNASVVASVARDGGVNGLIIDIEDYYDQGQYTCGTNDPPYEECRALARRRGAEVFGAVFRENPEATVLAYGLLSWDRSYSTADDLRAMMAEKRDLWPAFVNGILDAMPPTAVLVDGCEPAYGFDLRRGDFAASAYWQKVGLLDLVEPENRRKYQDQVRAGFGLYLDRYLRSRKVAFFGPTDGTAIDHFRRNFSAACKYADEYVWLYGEQQLWVKRDGWKPPKYAYEERFIGRTWEDEMPGLAETVRLVKQGDAGVGQKFEELRAAGSLVNLATEKRIRLENTTNVVEAAGEPPVYACVGGKRGTVCAHVPVKPGDWYAVEFSGRGRLHGDGGQIRWKAPTGYGWCWIPEDRKPVILRAPASGEDANEAWRTGHTVVRVPPGVGELVVWIRLFEKAEIKDIGVYKLF